MAAAPVAAAPVAAAVPVPPKPKPAPPVDVAPTPDAGPVKLDAFGVQAGVTPGERLKLNAAAVALLAAKADDAMTPADLQVLARYSGTGGCGASRNEFYTTPDVAAAMWGLLERAGFKGGDVLEPSCGTGVFLHTAPANAHCVGVELDPIGGKVAQLLHQAAGHQVTRGSLEAFAQQDGRLFDAVIGNAPFGIRGSTAGDDKKNLGLAEAYFLDTGLDKLRDGGVMAMIVPTGVVDGKHTRSLREDLLRKAEFLGASRLPNTAFEASHTSVTSDVLLFRKRPQEVAGALGTVDQAALQQLGVWDEEFVGGTYFTAGRGAANIHGTLEPGWRSKAEIGNDITVSGSMVGVPAALAAMPIEEPAPGPTVPGILELLGDDEPAKRRAISAALKPPYQVAKRGDVRTVDGSRYVLQGEPLRWHRADEDLAPAVLDALHIGEALDDLHAGQAKNPEMVRAGLVEDLDAFVAKHGAPDSNKALRAWLAQPSMPSVDGVGPAEHGIRVQDARRRAARLLGAVGDDGSYSDLVTGGNRAGGAASLDTMATKLSLEAGGFTVDQLGMVAAPDAVLDHLFASPAYAVGADGRTWTTMDTYLSGELWPKFDAATAAAADPDADPLLAAKWRGQAEALEATIAPASLEDVEILISSGFIQPHVITAWMRSRQDAKRKEYPNSYYPGVPEFAYDGALWTAPGKLGVSYDDTRFLLTYLNRTGVRSKDQEKLARFNVEFGDWVRGSDLRQEVEDLYNRTHRGFRAPVYSDAPIDIPGLNPPFEVNNYHWSGLRWALQAGSGIVADDVGLGKTPRGLMLAKLAQSTGQAKKPIIVAPLSVLANWMQSAEQWFPGAKILVIGETYKVDKAGNLTSKSDNADTRRAKYHSLQQNSYDFVFISQPAWNELDVTPELKDQYVSDEFWAKRGEALANAKDKKIARAKAADEQKVAVKNFERREGTVYFDELGVDMVIMDEGHAYKNLYSARDRFGQKPKFLGGSGESNRAQDTFYKTRAVRNANAGKGIFMLTATPTKNSPLEVYSMLAQIAPEAFERMGIANSEAFIDRFCEFTNDTILTVDGGTEEELVTSGFKNLDELREVMKRYIDRRTAADVGLVIPKGIEVDHYITMSDQQEATYQGLRAQYAAVKAGTADATGDSHIFSIMARMGQASLDLSLLDPSLAGSKSPKVEACVDTAIANAGDGGQLVFCDHVDMHEKLADAFVARGIPRNQIGIINASAAASSAARQKVCDGFNAGKLRFVIGNTPCMGEGVNLQKGTADIHHLDIPWDPASMHQRNGRGVRQGNKKGSVRLHSYLAKASFDGYRYQTMMAKRDWQDLLWNGGNRVENLARAGLFSREDQLIMLAANPEEARAKYAADKASAIQRKNTAERGAAIEAFTRYDKMGRALARLRAEQDPLKVQGTAIGRLAKKLDAAREGLRDMRGFTHKHLLKLMQPAVIEPITNHAWTAGAGLVLAGGRDGPVHYSQEETRWVVTAVDPDAGTVTARPYGHDGSSDATPLTMDLARMKEGVTPFEYDAATEAKAVADAKEAYRKLEAARTRRKMDDANGLGIKEMRDLDPEFIATEPALIKAHMRMQMEKYRDGGGQVYGMVHRDTGRAKAVVSYAARSMFGDHDVMLPTPENRQKAIDGYVREAFSRTLKTPTHERRGRYTQGEGLDAVYPDFEHKTVSGNPWAHVLKDVFGEDEVAATKAVRAAAVQRIADVPTFRDAMIAASKAAVLPPYGSFGRHGSAHPWPREVVQALVARATKDRILDWEVPLAAKPSSSSYNVDLHPKLLTHEGKDYAQDDARYGYQFRSRPKLREFLTAISHPDDRAGIKEAKGWQ